VETELGAGYGKFNGPDKQVDPENETVQATQSSKNGKK